MLLQKQQKRVAKIRLPSPNSELLAPITAWANNKTFYTKEHISPGEKVEFLELGKHKNNTAYTNILNIKLLGMRILKCNNQHLSNIWNSIHEKVKQYWGWVEKEVLPIENSV